ncbi:MAG: carbon-nitrogen hydrolase family protein [Burkholderiales bacterium]
MSATRVAAIQMVSAPEVASNLEAAGRLVAQAAAGGAKIAALPEFFCVLGGRDGDKLKVRERDGAGPIQEFLAETARRNRIWLVGGTVPLECGDAGRVRNASLVFDDAGKRVARYDKIHLFAYRSESESYDETRTIEPGDQPLAVTSPFGRLGLSVCYDLRFPELYRRFADVDCWFVPSAFTAATGAAHWEPLLRARAIENLCYVVAPAQGGRHPNGRRTHGHTMIVDPWGAVLAERDEGEGVVLADIDARRLAEVRQSLPALYNRKLA